MRIFNFIFCLKYPHDYYFHFQQQPEQSKMVCLFTFVNNGDLITGAAKMIFKVEFSTSFYSGRGQLLQADEVTTDSRTFWAFTSLE